MPTLEQAFSENPYPTRAEKEHLAQVTDMDYRQIHVWVSEGLRLVNQLSTPISSKTAGPGLKKKDKM